MKCCGRGVCYRLLDSCFMQPLLFLTAMCATQSMTPAGLEPAIPGSVGRCLIHWATGPAKLFCQIAVTICQVNARATLSSELIRAHELGH